jgi:glycosyltransferase involved in cell wall biosynthesis
MTMNSKIKSLLGDFDPSHPHPVVEPVTDSLERPKWSVMIPTYNCARFLRKTLESVLVQDPGSDQMQIEVIDDGSTEDDPEAVVREIGGGRIAFFRKPRNEGAVSNFNTCIGRSRGELVHILHGDDCVLPGFYSQIEKLANDQPDAALYACRIIYTDESDRWKGFSRSVPCGDGKTRESTPFFFGPLVQFSGTVIRRSFYETHGGFRDDLIHSADWNMWERAVSTVGGVFTDRALACYRMFDSNDTSRLMKTAENIIEYLRITVIFHEKIPGYPLEQAIGHLVRRGIRQELKFRSEGDFLAAERNAEVWKSICGKRLRIRIFLEKAMRYIMRRLPKVMRLP